MLDVLTRIRDYADNYVTDKVDLKILNFQPAGGDDLSVSEDFTFTIEAENESANAGGIRLKNVIWHVWSESEHPNIPPGTFFVPDMGNVHFHETPDQSDSRLETGDRVQELYIFPQGGRSVLDVNKKREFELSGTATNHVAGGRFSLKFEILATVDLGLPQSQPADPTSLGFDVPDSIS